MAEAMAMEGFDGGIGECLYLSSFGAAAGVFVPPIFARRLGKQREAPVHDRQPGEAGLTGFDTYYVDEFIFVSPWCKILRETEGTERRDSNHRFRTKRAIYDLGDAGVDG